MRKHYELRVWQEAMALAKAVYSLTASFPSSEAFGITAQMRRAAVSVPSNIAEGAARSSRKEFLHFLSIARGSLSELDTQRLLARQLGFTGQFEALDEPLDNTFKLLGGLINSLKNEEHPAPPHP